MDQQVRERRNITVSSVANRVAVERMEVYLLAVALKLGRYDSVTHLLTFTEAEVEALEAYLNQTVMGKR